MTTNTTRCPRCTIILNSAPAARQSAFRPEWCIDCVNLTAQPERCWIKKRPSFLVAVEIKIEDPKQPDNMVFMSKKFAEACINARIKSGMSMRDVAEIAGVSDPCYGKIQNGITAKPRPATVEMICKALSLNVEDYYEEL